MGRKKRAPTRIARVRVSDYNWIKKIALETNKSITQVWSEMIKNRRRGI